jgi:lipopolysaccharide/colanic/teichoic acid biosynthesis glycosyltransferase
MTGSRPRRFHTDRPGITGWRVFVKRGMDLTAAVIGLALTWWIIIAASAVSARVHGASGFFVQTRVGRYGQPFQLIKIRTMRVAADVTTNVTTSLDARITDYGAWLRRTKLDELPQLINVLRGEMSLVGPRPDVPGFADLLEGDDRIILSVRPGITGPASLAYRSEEAILANVQDPERYNREVIYPDKVRLNRAYVTEYSLLRDIRLLFETVFGRS